MLSSFETFEIRMKKYVQDYRWWSSLNKDKEGI